MADLTAYIRSIAITDDMAFTINVAEDDADLYVLGDTYTLGAQVMLTTGYHKIYESLKADNSGNNPPDNLTGDEPWWKEVSATNAWKVVDRKSRAATVSLDPITLSVTPGALVNSVAVLNAEAVEVIVTVTHPTLGVVYKKCKSLVDLSHLDSYYSWFFTDPARKASIIFDDLPAYKNTSTSVEVRNGSNPVSVGEVVFGALSGIGQLLWEYSIGFTDWSDKEVKDGVATIRERAYSNEPNFTVKIDSSRAASIDRRLKEYRATGIVIIGTKFQEETILYCFITGLKLVGKSTLKSIYTIEVQELS